MQNVQVYEVLADVFTAEEANTCFALLGDANMNWAAAMAARGCKFVYVRHEHCAVAASMAYARTTGKVGVATVTCGPGLTQIMTALPAAVRAHIPLVVFAGEAPVKTSWYNQKIDQKPFVDACGAKYVGLQHQQSMRSQVRDAFLFATTTQSPVVIGVPMDLQNEFWKEPLANLPASRERSKQMRALHVADLPINWVRCWQPRCRHAGCFIKIPSLLEWQVVSQVQLPGAIFRMPI